MHPIRCIRQACVLALGVVPALLGSASCLSRPVVHTTPNTGTVFAKTIDQSAVERIDLLFMIDDSRSMGDKQLFLAQAVPDLLTRLITPNCVDTADETKILGVSQGGKCAAGRIEFPPVHDMHIAVVTSGLGSLGGDVCNVTGIGPSPNGQDDDGQLIDRNQAVADAPAGFLAWFPGTPDNAGASATPGTPALGGPNADPTTLVSDFQQLVQGVGEGGCGIEAQLESWYRLLVQPDPYASITTSGNTATFQGVDAKVLKQRHDFLRPDSLLAIIDLSDENDSSVDPRAYNGTGVAGFHLNEINTPPFRGTSACASNPNDPACTSCDDKNVANDPVCKSTPNYDPVNDPQGTPNIRHVHMKQAYGLDYQYPLQRYVDGLTKTSVPDRDGEHPAGSYTYVGTAGCSNPIFSQDLPDGTSTDHDTLCHLKPGPRTADLVYYAHIGGVPPDLLHFDPTSPQKSQLTDDDWRKIVGNAPDTYDPTGIDPRMLETYKQRPTHYAPYGNYWDLAYACTFPLATPRDCTLSANADACDCANGTPPAGMTGWELCDPADPTKQISAKAYPTFRELYLAKQLKDQGVVSSLCPIHPTEQGKGDPLYGYRPAMAAIVERLKSALEGQCLPHQLATTAGDVPCLVLESLPQPGMTCDAAKGMTPADPQTLARAAQTLAAADAALLDPAQHTVCQVNQLAASDLVGGSCTQSQAAGWCYVQGATGGQCPDAILFSPSGQPAPGTRTLLACVESTPVVTQ